FERERMLIPVKGFEELLSSTNGSNRKLEEVLRVTREIRHDYCTLEQFYETAGEPEDNSISDQPGLPGSG
ncbi:DASH outer kinetochore protein, partial [Mycena floridula]